MECLSNPPYSLMKTKDNHIHVTIPGKDTRRIFTSPSHPFPTPRHALHSLQPFISQQHSIQFPQHPDDAPHYVLPASSCAPPIQPHQSQPLRLLRTSTTSSFHQNPLHFRHYVHFPFSFHIQCSRYRISVILSTTNTPPLVSWTFEDPLLPILRNEK